MHILVMHMHILVIAQFISRMVGIDNILLIIYRGSHAVSFSATSNHGHNFKLWIFISEDKDRNKGLNLYPHERLECSMDDLVILSFIYAVFVLNKGYYSPSATW